MLRRVSPVESKRYAFFQNFCAFLFMVAIIVRAVMAIAQAQNQIETRSGAGSCDNFLFLRNLRVLVRHQRTDAGGANPQTGQGYDVGVQVATRRTGQYIFFSEATYTITIRSTNGTSLDAVQLPSIWFANFADTYRDTSVSNRQDFMSSVAPWLIPPWEMIGGMHVQGTVSIVERRFITFSVFRDIVPSLKPTYRSASLFTITTTNTAPSPDNFTSSASLRSSQVSTLSYLNSPSGFMASKLKSSSMPPVCAFIEDYRSSTIFDAIGSIGGLLAVLQGAHILLFGRPLFWGLTGKSPITLRYWGTDMKVGAKLITPFGLFGGCHSRGFQRRLRDRYHRQPTAGQAGDAAEAIRIHAFLRDFVIDFGPADVENQVIESGRNMEPERLLRLQFDHDRFREDDEDDTNDT
ncbi:hypothetical protein FRC09_020481 [Ceratobasidium sp. 395]|nr:hypothetical protein FRC09_020481 [Ceratobasidium sp. 395]